MISLEKELPHQKPILHDWLSSLRHLIVAPRGDMRFPPPMSVRTLNTTDLLPQLPQLKKEKRMPAWLRGLAYTLIRIRQYCWKDGCDNEPVLVQFTPSRDAVHFPFKKSETVTWDSRKFP